MVAIYLLPVILLRRPEASSFLGGAALGLLQDFGPSHTPSVYVLLHYMSAQAALCIEVFLATLIQP